ncbi:MAG: co-chaperone DjlA [Desulfobacteraceae bacterium]|nr:co-chaperone DjlA [Desulfobacteraceae bacterium]MCB9494324.1 co-chaperone DjlA [Desulfobacteraceae bacterium]
MGWIGKLIGGTIGLGLGGPLGAILGAALGHRFDKSDEKYLEGFGGKKSSDFYNTEATQQKEMIFFVAAFSMLAKIAKADGQITDSEIKAVEDFMDNDLKLDSSSKNAAINIFRAARHSSESFESFSRQFYDAFKDQEQILELMIDVLFRVASSDGSIILDEEILIKNTSLLFGFSDAKFNSIKSKYSKINSSHYYAVLNCSPSDDTAHIKKQYRKLVSEYHPDKIVSKGLPDEFVELANEKFREIQEAYEAVSKERNL